MPLDRQDAFSGTRPVAPESLDAARLARYLEDNIPGFRGPLTLAQFKGGQSNPTYRLDTPTDRFVLRRKPPGALLASAHAVDREYRVMTALGRSGFPVPATHHLCTDDSIIGSPFYVMDHVEGRVFWEPHAPGLPSEERATLFAQLNLTIAKLHLTPLGDLADFGKPIGYVARQIRRWSEQYRASETGKIETMDRLIDWLPGVCPPDASTAIVHGDFRLDNCIVDAKEPRIVAVVDWELSTLGDPIADFTYHLMQWHMPVSASGGGVGSLAAHAGKAGIPDRDAYIEHYCRRTGRTQLPHLDVYLAYNFFRLAAILQGISGRMRDGTAVNRNAALMAGEVRPLAETAWQFARRAGA
jgi:aminoglycoside phosphotransferase (APT) family kinase protein